MSGILHQPFLLPSARHPTRTAAGSKDPAVSPRCAVNGTLGGMNYIHSTSQLKESKSSEI